MHDKIVFKNKYKRSQKIIEAKTSEEIWSLQQESTRENETISRIWNLEETKKKFKIVKCL